MKANLRAITLSAMLLFGATNNANATIYQFSFSNVTSNGVFAFLDFDTSTSNFRLYDNTANSYLESNGNLGVNGVAFDFFNPVTLNSPVNTTATNFANTTIGSLTILNTPPAGFTSAFRSANNTASNEIGTNESTSFNFGPISYTNIRSIALNLNSNNAAGNSNGDWVNQVSVTAIPEAETSAMFLAGLGLLGFVSRRRKQA